MRPLRLALAIALLPLCASVTWTVFRLLEAGRITSAGMLSPGVVAMTLGFLLWVLVYFTMPRPVRTYVLAHELSHAIWAMLSGARVSNLRVSGRGGSVRVSHSNIWITLAPYFFPFYTVLVIMLYGCLALFWDPGPYELFWLGMVGLTWSFHVTFTVSTLMTKQSDIQQYGYLFSYCLIYLLNVLGVCVWIVAVSEARLGDLTEHLSSTTQALYTEGYREIGHFFRSKVQ